MANRLVFPDRFLWGAATSAYQIEGAVDEGGRSPSTWDTFSHLPGTTAHGDNGDVACDHYHRVEADVSLMADLGLGAYRFSIAWPRVQPRGTGPANQDGLDHYRRLVDLLRAKHIEPVVTLHHWDLPQALQDDGGWTNRETAKRFGDYASIVADALGDGVELWITINEPWVEAFLGYGDTLHAPGLGEMASGVPAAHHLLVGHGMALQAIAAAARNSPRVGIALNPAPVSAASDGDEDLAAARRVDDQRNRWFLDALLRGSYPKELLGEYEALMGGVFVQGGDLDLISADLGFLAFNYYAPVRVAAAGEPPGRVTRSTPFRAWLGVEDRPPAGAAVTTKGWTIEADGLAEVLLGVRRDYGDLPMYITENGAAFYDYVDPTGAVRDTERIEYLRAHFAAAHSAIARGVDLRGYFVWSLYDNFEWADGYSQRFGIVFTDYRTQERLPKQSAHWYREVIAANAVDV